MSLRIIKAGLLDTVQDGGRYGYQHLGINPGGAMDRFSAALANALLGKELTSPVIEMHFPASHILFEKPCMLCITGADFTPLLNGVRVPLCQPIAVKQETVLSWQQWKSGARCYLSLLNPLILERWLGSFSTNLKAGAGGLGGKKLEKGDQLTFEHLQVLDSSEQVTLLPWQYNQSLLRSSQIHLLSGPEWEWLAAGSRNALLNEPFCITSAADRMGYRLQGSPLEQERKEQLVSSAVSFGTVQLLPGGQLIVLMADHQTTGGYPRAGSIISADLPKLAQMRAGDLFSFVLTE